MPDSLKPGQLLPDRTLLGADGEELSDGRPIVLVTGSVTCPLSISTLPMFKELNRQYSDCVAFAFVYTREAHPGENVGQPATLAAKVEHACLLKEIHGVDWPVLVDDLAGTLHRTLDTKQNSVHILGSDGTIVFRALFAGDHAVAKAIAAIAKDGQPHKSQALGRLAGPMKSIGYIEETLRRAGARAYRDVIKAVPPMAGDGSVGQSFSLFAQSQPWLGCVRYADGRSGRRHGGDRQAILVKDIASLLREPETTVAVVGATDNRSKYGSVIYRDLKRKGYTVYPVNLNRAKVDGDKAYPSLNELPNVPSIVNIVVPPSVAMLVLEESLDLGFMNV